MGIWNRLFRPPTKDKFAQLMMRAMRATNAPEPIVYDPAQFSLKLGQGQQNTVFLFNAYEEYVRAPRGSREKILRSYAGLSATPKTHEHDYESARPILLPKLRERFYHQSVRLMQQTQDQQKSLPFPHRVFSDDLTLELVCDYPDIVGTVSQKALDSWNTSFDDAMAVAKENLWRKSNAAFEKLGPNLYVSPWKDTHDASRLFLHDLIWQLPVKGDHVAMVPNRNVLLVTGSEDEDGLLKMARAAEKVMQDPRPMSGIAVRLDKARWVPFLPPPSRSDFWPLKCVAMKSRARDYAEQCRGLNDAFAKSGRDVFVAAQTLMQQSNGRMWTWTSWVDGITDALMPEADWFCFGRMGPDRKPVRLGFVPSQEIHAKLSDHLQPTDHYPVRYQVRTFPTQAQLAGLKFRPQPGET